MDNSAEKEPAPKFSDFSFSAIGTGWSIRTEESLSVTIQEQILSLIEDFDRTWSRFRTDSFVMRIAHAPQGGQWQVPTRDLALVDLYDELVDATGGAMDPLVGRNLELLGYDSHYSLTPDDDALLAPRFDSWVRDIRRNGSMLITNRSVVIDVGAAGKGFLVDLVAEKLRESGIARALVDGSGDLRQWGPDPITVGLEHPTRPGRVIGTVAIQDQALCASSSARRSWGDGLHHILDGNTRLPVSNVLATWAMASNAALADGLATALFVSDPAQLDAFEFSWVRMLTDGRIQWSNNFEGELFT